MQKTFSAIVLAVTLVFSVTLISNLEDVFGAEVKKIEPIKPKSMQPKKTPKPMPVDPSSIKESDKRYAISPLDIMKKSKNTKTTSDSKTKSEALNSSSDLGKRVAAKEKERMALATKCKSPIPSNCLDLRVGHIEVTQGIQDMKNSVFLVSRKDIYVRVYVEKNTNEPISGITGILEVCKEKGNSWKSCQTIQSYDGPKTIELNSIEDQRRFADQTLNFKISGDGDYLKEGPKLRLKATINPESGGKRQIQEVKYENNYDVEFVNLVRAHSLHIDFHPDKFGKSWCDKPDTAFFIDQLKGYTLKIFPTRQTLNDIGTDTHSLKYSGGNDGPGLDASGIGVMAELQGHKDPTATQGWPLEIALFCKNPSSEKGNMGMGWNEAAWAYGQSSSPNTILAHETAHAIGIGHVPVYPKEEPRYYDEHYKIGGITHYVKSVNSINPKTGEESTAKIICRDSKDLHVKGMGELLEDDSYPRYDKKYDLRASIGEIGFDGYNVMHPEVYTDIMSYCKVVEGTFMGQEIVYGGQWISPYNYAKLFNNQIVYDEGDKKLANQVINKQPR